MKKIFKGLSVLVASTALCAGIATATACSGGYNGEYIGSYHYNAWGMEYGMMVKVHVENNIITKVEDITNTDLSKQSGKVKDPTDETKLIEKDSDVTWVVVSDSWEKKATWNNDAAWLLQQYEGKSVAEVLDIKVFIQTSGCPYNEVNANNKPTNPQIAESGLMISGATQGSGRLMLAVQDALKNK